MSTGLASQRPLLVVTDLMGTTLRDDGAVLPACRAAFAECAIPFTAEELATKPENAAATSAAVMVLVYMTKSLVRYLR